MNVATDGTERQDRHRRLLGAGTPLFYDEPLHIVRGEGVHLFDDAGNRYLDVYNNVPCVGHANPRVTLAMANQAAQLNVHSRYLHDGVLDYAERLAALHAEPLTTTVFACTGTEANEIALAMARTVTGGKGIICTDATYHGNSAEVSKLTFTSRRPDTNTDPTIRSIPVPQEYRPIEIAAGTRTLCDAYLGRLQAEIDGFAADGVGFAGVIFCSIMANEGLPTIPDGFMARAAEIVRAAGGLVIADEVQAGFARAGRWWGYEVNDFVPDIAVMGKPMGSGLPLSAVVADYDHVVKFRTATGYFNTFAASPLQAAVGSAVIDEIEDRDLVRQVSDIGARLRAGLGELAVGVEAMGDVRGEGLFIGIDWVTDRETKRPDVDGAASIVDEMKRRGVLMGKAGQHGNVLKIRPPLVFDHSNADQFLEVFADVVD